MKCKTCYRSVQEIHNTSAKRQEKVFGLNPKEYCNWCYWNLRKKEVITCQCRVEHEVSSLERYTRCWNCELTVIGAPLQKGT